MCDLESMCLSSRFKLIRKTSGVVRMLLTFDLTKDGSTRLTYVSIHWVDRGTGKPKEIGEVNERDVCECDG